MAHVMSPTDGGLFLLYFCHLAPRPRHFRILTDGLRWHWQFPVHPTAGIQLFRVQSCHPFRWSWP